MLLLRRSHRIWSNAEDEPDIYFIRYLSETCLAERGRPYWTSFKNRSMKPLILLILATTFAQFLRADFFPEGENRAEIKFHSTGCFHVMRTVFVIRKAEDELLGSLKKDDYYKVDPGVEVTISPVDMDAFTEHLERLKAGKVLSGCTTQEHYTITLDSGESSDYADGSCQSNFFGTLRYRVLDAHETTPRYRIGDKVLFQRSRNWDPQIGKEQSVWGEIGEVDGRLAFLTGNDFLFLEKGSWLMKKRIGKVYNLKGRLTRVVSDDTTEYRLSNYRIVDR